MTENDTEGKTPPTNGASMGAQMLAERMQTHPEEFLDEGRFRLAIGEAISSMRVWSNNEDGYTVGSALLRMSKRDAEHLLEAFQTHVLSFDLTRTVAESLIGGKAWREAEMETRNQRLFAQMQAQQKISALQQGLQNSITGSAISIGSQQNAVLNLARQQP